MTIYIPLPVLLFITVAVGFIVIQGLRVHRKAKENNSHYYGDKSL